MAVSEIKIFSWGANSYGQLGQGDCMDLFLPKQVDIHSFLPKELTAVVGGGGHTLFLTDSGKCYGCGWNNKGQLGIGNVQREKILKPVLIPLHGKKMVKVAAGWDFSFVITEENKLYAFGSNMFGQLGLEVVKDICYIAEEVPVCGESVIDVSCGLRHSVVLTECGNVYTCGSSSKGQLGIQFQGEQPRVLRRFTKAAGHVLLWGSNKHGQITQNPKDISCSKLPYVVPKGVFSGTKFTMLVSGWTHMLAVTDVGDVYTWGRAEYGQIGRMVEHAEDHKPFTLNMKHPRDVIAGSEHNLLILDGTIYSWGWNEHGMCGIGDANNVVLPEIVPTLENYEVSLIGCGAGHSFAIAQKRT